ncbi:hypothetical protein BJY52DRAFT_804066 [Lactarius psammicola]|nr:hypothetical protein BJY52DRAFT_804066 [Lactarius psammicola]
MTVRLPLEVLTAIFEEVDDVHDLLHARMASRTLCAAATPFTFRVLSVITTRGSARNLGQLFDAPDIATHVREVSYHDTGADRRGRTLKYVRTNAIQELASSFSRVHQLPHLETINLTFYPVYDNLLNSDGQGRPALQTSILGALAASFSVCTPPKLTTLSLHNLRTSDPSDSSPLESAPFQSVLTTLRRLQLSVLFDSAPDPYTFSARWRRFWATLIPRVVLTPTQHTLTELTLHSDTYVGALSGLSLAGLHFPHLCVLSLRKLVFEPSIGIEPFILRHAATLAQLELLICKLPAHVNRLLPRTPPPSTTHPRDEESSHRPACWERIWDRFAVELTALVSLRVDERPWGSAGPECRYVYPGLGTTFLEIGTAESRNTADAAALRRFHMTVAARSEEMRGEP